ncbi:MAG: transcriptional repressor NrdR [Proteobacteria bacterium]|nr:transcriptional repressor NrdR [Pseudomonadota bacterium]
MHCPFCQHEDTRVIDSRLTEDGSTVRRRRECPACGERFNTFENAELKLPAVVKNDGRREAFDESKLRTSFERALQKRPVSPEQVDAAVRHVIHQLRLRGEREIPSRRIGELVMAQLKPLDQVGYVRFASVYRAFEDVAAFRAEIDQLERDAPSVDGVQLPLLDESPEPDKPAKARR